MTYLFPSPSLFTLSVFLPHLPYSGLEYHKEFKFTEEGVS